MLRRTLVLCFAVIVISPSVLSNFECERIGRFADLTDPTCKSYFLCSKFKGELISTSFSCFNSKFNPNTGRCSTIYKCPTPITSTIETPVDKSNEELTQLFALPALAPRALYDDTELVCTVVGRFPDTLDPFCRRYYLCSRFLNGTFIKTPYLCPINSYFDPSLGRCNRYYLCAPLTTTPVLTTTPKIVTTTQPPRNCTVYDGTSSNINFSCGKVGRFADFRDDNCQRYFLCNKLLNGTYLQTPYNCPLASIFDNSKGLCSIMINCHYCK